MPSCGYNRRTMVKPRRPAGTPPPEQAPPAFQAALEAALREARAAGARAEGATRDLERSQSALRAAQARAEAHLARVEELSAQVADLTAAAALPRRRKLPTERQSMTHHLRIGEVDLYLVVGLFPDGTPGEVFLRIAKQGSDLAGWADQFAQLFSLCLQLGVPLEDLAKRFVGARFDPAGFTNVANHPIATSPVDLIARVLLDKYTGELGGEDQRI